MVYYDSTYREITNKQIQTLVQQLKNTITQGNAVGIQPPKNKFVITLQRLEILFRKEEELIGLFEIAD